MQFSDRQYRSGGPHGLQSAAIAATLVFVLTAITQAAAPQPTRPEFQAPPIRSSWDDLLQGVKSKQDWAARRADLRQKYLELLRDQYKPDRPPLDLQVHEAADVEGIYTRKLISYNVEVDERCRAFLAIPKALNGPAPAVVAIHGTFPQGKEQTAGLTGNPDKAYFDHLARRGYVVIAPDHFCAGDRTPPEGPYETARFYAKHPEWTAVGKFTFEGSIAIDVLQSLPDVDKARIGVTGHSLGGHSSFFLAAYDERIAAGAGNCSAGTFRHNPGVLHWSRDKWYIYFKPLRPGLLEGRLPPIDIHHIISLIAPRPFLDIFALNDGDKGMQRQRLLMDAKIAEVYQLVGAPENFGFYVHGRGHSLAHESRELLYGWLDAHLKPPEAIAAKLVK